MSDNLPEVGIEKCANLGNSGNEQNQCVEIETTIHTPPPHT